MSGGVTAAEPWGGSAPKGLTVLYRGQLSSCNFDCPYCPFAKRTESRAVVSADRVSLQRFVAWARAEMQPLSVFFTPWGEALVRSWYRDAQVELSWLPHVRRVAVQTNLSGPMTWVAAANADRVGVWATWHPAEMPLERFAERVKRLATAGVHVSAGIVGLPEHEDAAKRLRDAVPGVYVWVNAVKRDPAAMGIGWEAVDPLFGWNARAWPSEGRACRTGEEVVTVDGAGDVRRCHFVADVIANLYDGTLPAALKPRPCPNATCGCHIGYVHLRELGLDEVFGEGVLERVPGRVNASNVFGQAVVPAPGSWRPA